MNPGQRSRRRILGAGAVLLATMVGRRVDGAANSAEPRLVFLTRNGCVNTTLMRERLDEALHRLRKPRDYVVIDADSLKEDDRRRGYGTPTILARRRDLFGLAEPNPPLPSPT